MSSRRRGQDSYARGSAVDGRGARLSINSPDKGLRWRQSPLLLQTVLQGAENEAVHEVAEDDDQNHDGDHLAHVVEVAAHHQQLAQAQAEEDHLGLNQRTPRKGPSLFHAVHDERQAGGQKYGPEQPKAAGSQVTSRHAVNPGHLLASVFHRDGHRQQRAHQNHEQNRFFGQAEPQDGQRNPANAGQRLQAHQQSPQSFFEELVAAHAEPDDHSQQDGQTVADQHALHGDRDADPEAAIGKAVKQGACDSPRRGEQVRGPDMQLRQQGPNPEQSAVEHDLFSDFFHRRIPLPETY